jgi:hypothetical protein
VPTLKPVARGQERAINADVMAALPPAPSSHITDGQRDVARLSWWMRGSNDAIDDELSNRLLSREPQPGRQDQRLSSVEVEAWITHKIVQLDETVARRRLGNAAAILYHRTHEFGHADSVAVADLRQDDGLRPQNLRSRRAYQLIELYGNMIRNLAHSSTVLLSPARARAGVSARMPAGCQSSAA